MLQAQTLATDLQKGFPLETWNVDKLNEKVTPCLRLGSGYLSRLEATKVSAKSSTYFKFRYSHEETVGPLSKRVDK